MSEEVSILESTGLIISLIVLFIVIGVSSTLIYYFARYYVKTDAADNELLTKKPIDLTSKNLNQALLKTKEGLVGRLKRLNFQGQLTPAVQEEIEEILFTSDLGPQTAEFLIEKVAAKLSRSEKGDIDQVRETLRTEMKTIFSGSKDPASLLAEIGQDEKPVVWMIVGVNGVGKTTTIGKLAAQASTKGLKVLIVAGDTFRAAADSQLKVWAQRAACEIYSSESVKDPSAVVYAGLERALASQVDLVIVDTAGRLHTQDHLMEELKKMKRVMVKLIPEAPHERLLVIDANAGQNALIQAREFNAAVDLTGVIITKMDGSSKAGVAVGVVNEIHVPIVYVGIGEAIEDLRLFDAKSFVEAIV